MISLIVFFTVHLWAESLESHYLHTLARARTSREVEIYTEAYETLKITRTACRIQLQEQEVPFTCYEVEQLALQMGWRDNREPAGERIIKLDRLCFAAAEKLKIAHVGPNSASLACKRKIEEARRIQAYRDEEAATWSEN